MKKIFLSLAVVLSFILYSFSQRSGSDEQPVSQNGTPSQPASSPQISNKHLPLKDGQYSGSLADAFYGNVQVQVSIVGGKISDVQFLDYPHDRGESIQINSQAMPLLKTEVIQTQSANVDVISGATQTSEAFVKSMQSALIQAQG